MKYLVSGLYVDDSVYQAFRGLESNSDVITVKNNLLYTLILKISRKISTYMSNQVLDFIVFPIVYLKFRKYNRKEKIVLFFIESLEALCPAYIRTLKKFFVNSKTVLFLVNTLDEYEKMKIYVNNVKQEYNLIITCNKKNALDNNWKYHPDCYTSIDGYDEHTEVKYDIVFLGAEKGREKIAHDIFEKMVKNGKICNFIILGPEKKKYVSPGFRYINKPMPYKDYLKIVSQSKCILEITPRNESFCTLRTMEAYTYKKLLLTNNKSISSESFYSPKNIFIYRNADDIDIDFINNKYYEENRTNPFSTENLLLFIRTELERM